MQSFVFSFGEGHIHDGYAVIEIAESIHLAVEHVAEYCAAVRDILLGKPHVAIFQYQHNFSYTDTFYAELNRQAAVIGLVFVCNDNDAFHKLERLREEIEYMPVMLTTSLSDAISWTRLQLNKHQH